jgi:SAM-dependent methyltransferase
MNQPTQERPSMAQRDTGIYRLLSSPAVYSAIQKLIGGTDGRAVVVRDFIRPQPGERVLDIGCGPATMLNYLEGVNYTGLDFNPAYIAEAKVRYGDRGTFLVQSVDDLAIESGEGFDTVLAIALLHHLSDAQSLSLFLPAQRRAADHAGLRVDNTAKPYRQSADQDGSGQEHAHAGRICALGAR